jgi:hypothetical protein
MFPFLRKKKSPSDISESFFPLARQWKENLGENPSHSSGKTPPKFPPQ